MTLKQIASLGRELTRFLLLFATCFQRSEGRNLLAIYVKGQLSNVHRKNAEAMAIEFGVAPRTLQGFLESIKWEHDELRNRCQIMIAKEHAHPLAIGCLDESGTAKSGLDTVGAARQYNGNRGKIEVCTVAVHLSYCIPGFQVLLDSQMYLPKDWANDPERRKKNHVPEQIAFMTKQQIGVELIDRSIANGITVSYWTFDELYGRDHTFLDALESRGLSFIGEVPKDARGWLVKPKVFKPREKRAGRGRPEVRHRVEKRHKSCKVENLVKHSPVFRNKSWQRYKVKETGTGPQVWEVKWAPIWRKNARGLPTKKHCLIVMRNVLSGEMKYFLSNRVPGIDGTTVRRLLYVALSRWSVESVFRESKEELGMDHYECRGWQCVHRHFFVTALSHLFCARMRLKFDPTDGTAAERLSIEQVRSAVNTYLSTADLSRLAKELRIEKEIRKQTYHQRRNQQAATSHSKTRTAKFHSIGIDPNRIKSCVPNPDPGS